MTERESPEGRTMIIVKKEEGVIGIESFVWWGLAIIIMITTFYFVTSMNYYLSKQAWKSFLYLMRPENLFPNILNLPDYPRDNPKGMVGMMSAGVYLSYVIMQKIVYGLIVLVLYFVGIIYLYPDMFEQYTGWIKGMLPRIILSLILAFGSLYAIQFLMILGRSAYEVLYYQSPGALSTWQNPEFFRKIYGDLSLGSTKAGPLYLPYTQEQFIGYLWSLLSMILTSLLLILLAVRDILLAILTVLLPLASILLLTPMTSQIGRRLWWLAISLIFLPFVMILPLMLIGPVANHVSFVVAGFLIAIGSLYLLWKEPQALSGVSFTSLGVRLVGSIGGGAYISGAITPVNVPGGVFSGREVQVALKGGLTGGEGVGKLGNVEVSGESRRLKGGYAASESSYETGVDLLSSQNTLRMTYLLYGREREGGP